MTSSNSSRRIEPLITRAQLVQMLAFDGVGEFYWRDVRRGRPSKRGELKAGYMAADGRVMVRIQGVPYQATHLATLWHFGKLPIRVDLIDRNPRNLRKDNLRIRWPHQVGMPGIEKLLQEDAR